MDYNDALLSSSTSTPNSSAFASAMQISLLHSETLAMEVNDDRVISLLQNTANVNQSTITGETPLHYVCHGNMCTPHIIEILVSHGANVNFQTVLGETPLHFVCRGNVCTPAIIRMLLGKGANVNSVCRSHCTPLNFACRWLADMDSIRALLVGGANPDMHGRFDSNIFNLVNRQEHGSLLLLIEYGASLQDGIGFYTLGSPLDYACFHGYLECTQILLGAGMDADMRASGPLGHLIFSTRFIGDRDSQTKICALLVSGGARVKKGYVEELKKHAADSTEPETFHGMLSCLMQRRSHPLSLSELCRKNIRMSLFPLQLSGNPVSAVCQLGLPTKLQEFILFNYQDMLVKYRV